MNIFKKRPLSLILCIMLGGFSLFVNTSLLTKLVAGITAGLAVYLCRGVIKKFIDMVLPYVLLSAFACSLILAQLFSVIFYPRFSENEVSIKGEVIEVNEYIGSYGIVVETDTIDNKRDSHNLLAYVSKEKFATVEKYDIVEFSGIITKIEADEQFEADIYYGSRGVSGTVERISAFSVIGKAQPDISYYLEQIRNLSAERINGVTSESTSPFLRALVLGDRTNLDGNTKLNFKRLGISHILALSGMHLTIVCFGVMKLLSLLRVNKNIKLITVGIITVFYMALTGFSPTICRAAIMSLLVYLLFLLRYKTDIFTSLMISVSIIVLFEPYSIFDISLQLSFLSILGIIACQDVLAQYRPASRLKRLLFIIPESVAISVFANIAIMPLCISKFGMVSILSPISTLMFSFVCTLLIYLGILVIFFGNFLFLGDIADFITKALKHAIEFVSDSKWVFSSANFEIVKILSAIAFIIFLGYVLFKVRRKSAYSAVFCSLYILALVLSCLLNTVHINKSAFTLTMDKSDSVLIKADGDSMLIYSGGNSVDSAYSVVDYLDDNYISYLDRLVIQNYNTILPEFIDTVASNVKVDRILLLEPQSNYEKKIATEVAKLLQYYGTDMRFYSLNEEIGFYEYTLSVQYHTFYEYGEAAETVYTITKDNGEVYTYVTEGTRLENYSQIMRKTDCLIIGGYGDSYSSSYLMKIKCDSIDKIIIGCKLRLDEATKQYYNEKGATVYYTAAPINLLN